MSVSAEKLARVKENFAIYMAEEPFHEGQVVTWKPTMKNRRMPAQKEGGIITRILPEPIYDDEKSSGKTSFREPLTVVVGLVDEDGDFIEFHLDGHRLRSPLPGEIPENQIIMLQERYRRLQREDLHEGDLVTFKPGFRNKKHPVEGQPAIIMKLLPQPVIDPQPSSGSCYFHEMLDMIIGIIDADGDLLLFHNDSRRFHKISAGGM